MDRQVLNMIQACCICALLIIALIAVDPMSIEKLYYSEPTSNTITDDCVDDYINEDWEVCTDGEYK